MASTHEDEDRFVSLINAAIASGEIKSTAPWKKHLKDTKGKERRRKAADKEAKEAEELARELGVHDKLFGAGRSAGASDSADAKGGSKSKGKGKAKAGKGGAADGAEDSEAALRALIQGNQAKRMGSLVDSLEAKYAAIEASKKQRKGGKKRPSSGRDEAEDDAPKAGGPKRQRGPTDDEFAAIQAKLDARRNGRK